MEITVNQKVETLKECLFFVLQDLQSAKSEGLTVSEPEFFNRFSAMLEGVKKRTSPQWIPFKRAQEGSLNLTALVKVVQDYDRQLIHGAFDSDEQINSFCLSLAKELVAHYI